MHDAPNSVARPKTQIVAPALTFKERVELNAAQGCLHTKLSDAEEAKLLGKALETYEHPRALDVMRELLKTHGTMLSVFSSADREAAYRSLATKALIEGFKQRNVNVNPDEAAQAVERILGSDSHSPAMFRVTSPLSVTAVRG